MISVCIPIYNFNISPLLAELTKQLSRADIPVELVLIDDCSSIEFKRLNKSLCKKHTYIELEKNIGRASIRNLFLQYARYENLLFLDCDSQIVLDDFLSNYIDSIKKTPNPIICGGRIYDPKKPERNKILHWKYGMHRESKPSNIRNLYPSKSFMTNNFLISKQILSEIKFDERLNEYGHEDTLFGYQLKKKGFAIKHIENPVLNGDIESNIEFLGKTEKGIHNLISILNYVDFDKEFISDIAILRFYYRMKALRLIWWFGMKFYFLRPLLKYMFRQGYVNLWLFDFYKLGVLIKGLKINRIKT
ncbi:MAG: glycosyltransferase family 2 protein [Bacteroidales bacterium]|nr:glycosyltransferase family 2 protein [Bacteroidales bacterium]